VTIQVLFKKAKRLWARLLKSFWQDDSMPKLFQIILPLNYFAIKPSDFFEFCCPMAPHMNCFAPNSFALKFALE